MPFIPRAEVVQLERENAALTEELSKFREMEPLLGLAAEIRDGMVELMTTEATAREVGALAYQMALDKQAGRARGELAAKYERSKRDVLYQQVLGEIAVQEGPAIEAEVSKRIETDPDLVVKLRDSARKELAAKAKENVKNAITAEQQKHIDAEAERQLELDRFDVRFAIEGELDLTDEKLAELLRPGDVLDIAFMRRSKEYVRLEWMKDANDRTGWVYKEASWRLSGVNALAPLNISQTQFVSPAAIHQDLVEGTSVVKPNLLVAKRPLAFIQGSGDNAYQQDVYYVNNSGHYTTSTQPVEIAGCDLQVRSIHF